MSLRCDISFNKDDLITYDNIALGQTNVTDYTVTSSAENILDFDVLDPKINFSDHYPVAVSCKLSTSPISNSNNLRNNLRGRGKNYDEIVTHFHADLLSFYHYTWIMVTASSQ